VYAYQNVVIQYKLKLTFLFSLFRSKVDSTDTKMYLHGFQERMFSIQEQGTLIFFSGWNNVASPHTKFQI